jgi:glyceraldehyde 3-phosphate dehydrogenase
MTRIALNGLGRIGKLVLRDLIDTGCGGEIVLLNDPVGTAEQHALLMEFDSVHGRWRTPVSHGEGALALNGQTIRLTHEKTIEALPLAELGVDMVIDCTGVFKTAAKIAPYYAAGVKKVVVSAPVKDGGALNLVYGVNHQLYDGSQALVTAASCTTNCLAPVVKVIHEALGIRHGSITTIHDVTNTQTIVDRPAKDMRRARSALNFIRTLEGTEKPLNTPAQALALMKIIDGAYKSAATGKPVAL